MQKRRKDKKSGSSRFSAWRRPVTFGGVSARIVMLALAGLQVLSFASMLVNPAKAWIFNVFGLLFLPLFIVNLILFLWALKRRSRACLIPLAALFPSVFFVGGYFQFPSGNIPADPSPGEETVRVVSYNVGRFLQADERKVPGGRPACTDSVRNFLAAQDADIICLQEFYTTDVGRVRAFLSKWLRNYRAEYYFYRSRHGYYGNVTLSRMKAEDKGVIKFDNSANLALYTDYSVGDESFPNQEDITFSRYTPDLRNADFSWWDLASQSGFTQDYNISLSGLLRSIRRNDRDILRETEYKMRRGISQRPRQVNRVMEHISGSPVDAFVCGDFNDTPMSYTCYRLSKGRDDSFRKAGEWFGATFSFLWPLLRIDYVLYPERFRAVSHRTPHKPYSDHYPVVTEISLSVPDDGND